VVSALFPLGSAIRENCTNCLYARGKVGGNVEQLAGARGGLASELVYQLLAGGASDEGPDDVGVCDVGKLGTLLGESPNEVSEGLIRLLPAPEVPEISRAHVCAVEVPDKVPD